MKTKIKLFQTWFNHVYSKKIAEKTIRNGKKIWNWIKQFSYLCTNRRERYSMKVGKKTSSYCQSLTFKFPYWKNYQRKWKKDHSTYQINAISQKVEAN